MIEPIWLILVPLMTGFSFLFIDIYAPKSRRVFIISSVVINFSLAVSLLRQVLRKPIIYKLGSWTSWLGINLIVDPFSGLMAVLIAGISGLIVIYSFIYIQENKSKYYGLLFFLIAGMMGMVLTGDLFNLFVFMEVTSLAAYALVAFEKEAISFEASFKYLVIGSISGFFVLLGIILTYQATGTLNLAELVIKAQTIPVGLQKLILALFVTGLGAKFAVVPLHTWLPAAHPAAPSPISALLSGVVIKVFGYALIRLLSVLYLNGGLVPFNLDLILMYTGVLTLLLGHLLACQQTNLKRLLAYSSIAQIGYIMIGLSVFSSAGLDGAIMHILNHALVKVSLFLTAGIFIFRLGIDEISELKGIGYRLAGPAFIFTVSALAIIGLPPFNCFISKWLIAKAALEKNYLLPAGSIFLGSILALRYYLRVITILYTKQKTAKRQQTADWNLEFVPLLLASFCLLLGIIPGLELQIVERIPKFILEPINYYGILLGG